MSETTWKCYACGEGVPDHFELGSPDSWHMRDTTPGAASGSTMRPLHDRCSSNKEQLSADSDFEAWWQALDWRARAQPNELTVKAAWEESKRLRDERIAELERALRDAKDGLRAIAMGLTDQFPGGPDIMKATSAELFKSNMWTWSQQVAYTTLSALSPQRPEPDTLQVQVPPVEPL